MRIFLCAILFMEILKNVAIVSTQSNNFFSNPNVLLAIDTFRRLEPKIQHSDIKTITVYTILKGMLQTEENMEQNIIKCIEDMLKDSQIWDLDHFTRYTTKINRQMVKDKRSLEMLANTLDIILGVKSSKEFLSKMQQIMLEVPQTNNIDYDYFSDNNFENESEQENESNIFSNKIKDLEENIMHNVKFMRRMADDNVETALNHLIKPTENHSSKNQLRKTPAKSNRVQFVKSSEVNPNNYTELLDTRLIKKEKDNADSGNKNQIRTEKAENKGKQEQVSLTLGNEDTMVEDDVLNINNLTATQNDENKAKQEEGSLETFGNDEPMGGGGLVALISNLSGGEGGSDVGALIGALSGVIANVLGPGGVDVESLIGTATSLISGLLAGNRNFGTVLGRYVGTAVDGVSGGGGAINNGQFVGNFLGTVLAFLSANPEGDEAGGITPFIFIQNFIHSFIEAKNRPTEEEDSEETQNIVVRDNTMMMMDEHKDSGYFIKSFISSITTHIVSIIFKAFLGSSAGASQASANTLHQEHY